MTLRASFFIAALAFACIPVGAQPLTFVVEAGQSMLNPVGSALTQNSAARLSRVEFVRNAFWQNAITKDNIKLGWEFVAPGAVRGDACDDFVSASYQGGELDAEQLRTARQALAGLRPSGRADTSTALQTAISAMPGDGAGNQHLWLVIDGEANCGPSICTVLADTPPRLSLNVMFLGDELGESLSCLTNTPNVLLHIPSNLDEILELVARSFDQVHESIARIQAQEAERLALQQPTVPSLIIFNGIQGVTISTEAAVETAPWQGRLAVDASAMSTSSSDCFEGLKLYFPGGETLELSPEEQQIELDVELGLNQSITIETRQPCEVQKAQVTLAFSSDG